MPLHEGPSPTRAGKISSEARQQLLDSLNRTESTFPTDVPIHHFIEACAADFPQAVAVEFGDEHITYSELNQDANLLAAYLQKHGVTRNSFVALCLERSLEMIVGIVGILKAGAAYIPIDPGNPDARQTFILEDSGAQVIVTNSRFMPGTSSKSIRYILLDEDWARIARTKLAWLQANSSADDLAYIMYTSGSTGTPKGVMVPHRQLVNSTMARFTYYHGPVKRFLLLSSFAFDSSVAGIFWSLCQGGTLCLPRQGDEQNPDLILRHIERQQITHLLCLPSLYSLILDAATEEQTASLETVIVAGETCSPLLCRRHFAKATHARLFNEYGPTEATVWSTIYEIPVDFESGTVPIGKPIANTHVYILDNEQRLLPYGEVGELYLGGANIAAGYMNRKKLTEERFVPNPFRRELPPVSDTNPGQIDYLYRTGDLVRYLEDGNLAFIGRTDQQVKLRGFRIELGEIENTLRKHRAVKEAVCMVRSSGSSEKRLAAYIQMIPGQQLTTSELREHISLSLPDYMLPSKFVFLKEFPQTANGKINRNALPAPGRKRPELDQAYREPRKQLERWLASIWSEVLEIDKIGVDDRFFELGGSSIQAARLISTLQRELNESIFVVSLFDAPSIASYANFLEAEYATALRARFEGEADETRPDPVDEINDPVMIDSPSQINSIDIRAFKKHVYSRPFPATDDPKKTRNKKAMFILAPPRSGTTLLRVMLAGHPNLFAASELQLLQFNTLQERKEAFSGKFSGWLDGTIRTIMELRNCDGETARQIMTDFERKDYSTRQFYDVLQGWIGTKRMLIDKTPQYALDLATLGKAEEDFDQPFYVHLVRHPYSMITSFVRKHMEQVIHLRQHSFVPRELGELVWLVSHQNILQFLADIPADRHYFLRYEDLVTDPGPKISELCDQFGLPFHKGMLTPYENTGQKMTDGVHAESTPMDDPNFLGLGKIDPAQAERWKGVLKDNFLSASTWHLAGQFNYPDITPDEEQARTAPETKATPPSQVPESHATAIPLPAPTKRSIPRNGEIAIIGMAGRFPGAKSVEELWENLKNGVESIRSFSDDELLAEGVSAETLEDANYVKAGAPLEDAEKFDAGFFGYHAREVELMDPQHRLFLECCYTALEHAGYSTDNHREVIGVFGGVARNAYLTSNLMSHDDIAGNAGEYTMTLGSEKDFTATRVAYKLNLRGPAFSVQTACSSSGVAIHLACQSIRNRECDMAIAGGCRVEVPQRRGYHYIEGGPLSPDGHCRAFDAGAKGMVRGSGGAFLVLKSLEAAVRDGDTIHAVIKSSAINNDGASKAGFTAPSVSGQADCVTRAIGNARIDPATIGYVEAHGTGTELGDPIEIAGLTRAWREQTDRKQFCAIGSIKTNIGHLDAGAAAAGLIKAALTVKHGLIPPSLNYQSPNPQIDFDESPFFVNDTLQNWPAGEHPRRAAVSSLGLGGTNAHIIIEQAPEQREVPPDKTAEILLLSARSESALDSLRLDLATYMQSDSAVSLADISHTLQWGRKRFEYRMALYATSLEDAGRCLAGEAPHRLMQGQPVSAGAPITFMFPGGGAEYLTMGRQLYDNEKVFRNAIDECAELLLPIIGENIRQLIYPENNAAKVREQMKWPSRALPALFTVQYATALLWRSWGIEPEALIGHSMGEYTAACIAGVFSLKDALALVAKRGELFETLEPGAMLSVPLPEETLRPYLGDTLSIAAINRVDLCVVSGPREDIEMLGDLLTKEEIESQLLHIAVAAHSRMVDPILAEFRNFLTQIEFRRPLIRIVSTVNGEWLSDEDATDINYWVEHLRNTVRFAGGLQKLFEEPQLILIETGPGQTLSTSARQHPGKLAGHTIISSLRHPKEEADDYHFFLSAVAKLWLAGIEIDWQKYRGESVVHRVPVPTYPFERKRYWIDAEAPVDASRTSEGQLARQQFIRDSISALTNGAKTVSHQDQELPRTRSERIAGTLQQIIHGLSGVTPEKIDTNVTFLELGFDSLFLTQAKAAFQKRFNVRITFRHLFDETPTISSLADYIDSKMPETAFPEPVLPFLVKPIAAVIPSGISANVPVSGTEGASDNFLQVVIDQQLQIMRNQLAALSGGRPPDLPGVSPRELPPLDVRQPVEKGLISEPSAHGAWKPIQRVRAEDYSDTQKEHLQQLIRRYTDMTKGSKALTENQRPFLADPRAVTGFRHVWKEMVYQIASERSKGCRIWDVDGNEYIDLNMGFGVNLFGHSPEFIVEAITEQAGKGIELGVLTPLAKEVAELICELTGHERVNFVNTGSEAVSGAVRAARTATGRDKIAVFEKDYHGISDELLVRSVTVNGVRRVVPVAPGIPLQLVDNVIVLSYEDSCIEVIRAHAHELAAVIFEPVPAHNPAFTPREIIHKVREVTRELDIAMIFDELITGFRLHPRGAQAFYDVDADICAYGKVLCGGLPMAAIAGRSKYMNAFDGGPWQYGDDSYPEAGVTFFGGTFVRHPLSMATSRAFLRCIKESGSQLYDELNQKTARFAANVNALFAELNVAMQLVHCGSMIQIRFQKDGPFNDLFYYFLRLNGVLFRDRSGFLCVDHSSADLALVLNAIKRAVQAMIDGGFLTTGSAETAMQNDISHSAGEDQNTNEIPENGAIENGAGEHGVIENGAIEPTADGEANDTETPEEIADDEAPADEPVPAEPLELKTTAEQREVWLACQMNDGASCAFNLSSNLLLSGVFKAEAFDAAVDKLIARHQALRTCILPGGESQKVLPALDLEIQNVDISRIAQKDRKAALEERVENDSQLPFDLVKGPLIRIQLIKWSTKKYIVMLSLHHMICDGWSMGVLINDLARLYHAEKEGIDPELPQPLQFSEYMELREDADQQLIREASSGYWVDQFSELPAALDLPLDQQRPRTKTYRCANKALLIPSEEYARIKAFSKERRSTNFATLMAAYSILLTRLSGQEDIVIGLAAAGQSRLDNQNLIGHCVTLLPVRMRFDGKEEITALLERVKATLFEAYDHQDYTFSELLNQLKVPRDPARTPLVSNMITFESESAPVDERGLSIRASGNPKSYCNFDLELYLMETSDGLRVRIEFNTDLFDLATITQWLRYFRQLVLDMCSNANRPVSSLRMMSTEMQRNMLIDWNDTWKSFPHDQGVHHLFELSVDSYPDKLAIRFPENGAQMTYQELDRASNQFAHYLVQNGVRRGDRIGICLERDKMMIIGVLGVLKAGATYIPLDPGFPQQRLCLMLDDADANRVLTTEALAGKVQNSRARLMYMDRDSDRISAAQDTRPKHGIDPGQLAYVIYTSGSTGRPKGVQIRHQSVVNFLHSMKEQQPGCDEHCKLLAITTISFDISVLELFLPLISGGTAVIASRDEAQNAERMIELMDLEEINMMQATPATWSLLIESGWQGKQDLKLLCGGEALSRQLMSVLVTHCKELWNMYGPTETTIWSTVQLLNSADGIVSIGKPIANTACFVLDANHQPVPPGVTGELYIGGQGLAEGYRHRLDLTMEKFIPLPETLRKLLPYEMPLDKLYRTGDLARYYVDGKLECLGRLDNQIKIRGFRVEAGEIESTILREEAVEQVVVVMKEISSGDQRLLAYLTLRDEGLFDEATLRSRLRGVLPEYMVPAAFMKLAELPMTPNNKIDRKALPLPQTLNISIDIYVEPRNDTEAAIAEIWARVLHVERPGIHSNFFELGGHSLLATRVITRIRERLGVDFPLQGFFEQPTIAEQAEIISMLQWAAQGDTVPVTDGENREEFEI